MREIKFRVYDKTSKKIYEKILGIDWSNGKIIHIQIWDDEMGRSRTLYPKDEPILMQYTDLNTKNGKEIYGKYIVGFIDDDCNGVVFQRKDGCWMIRWCDGSVTPLISAVRRKDFIVKGNIYENPELIKEVK